jgi:hypothetical protein
MKSEPKGWEFSGHCGRPDFVAKERRTCLSTPWRQAGEVSFHHPAAKVAVGLLHGGLEEDSGVRQGHHRAIGTGLSALRLKG